MSALRSGPAPVLSSCAIVALTALAGCSSTGANYTAQDVPVAPRVAQSAVVVEDDGLPAQSPPPARINRAPDNPDEPFSKNYGGGNPAVLGIGKPGGGTPADHVPREPADTARAFPRKVASAAQDE